MVLFAMIHFTASNLVLKKSTTMIKVKNVYLNMDNVNTTIKYVFKFTYNLKKKPAFRKFDLYTRNLQKGNGFITS